MDEMKKYTVEEMEEFYQEYKLTTKPKPVRRPRAAAKLPEFKVYGPDYIPKYDKARLRGQTGRIYDLMSDGAWRTLGEINVATNAPEASASAALRSFRRDDMGGHVVERRRRGNPSQGLYEYKLIINGGSI